GEGSMGRRMQTLKSIVRSSLRRRPAVIAGVVLVAALAPVAGSALLPGGAPRGVLRAQNLDRATPGGGTVAMSGHKPVTARKGSLPKPLRLSRPTVLHLTKAPTAVFDVRKLKSTVVRRERPEHPAPGEVEQPGTADPDADSGLPATVSPSSIAAVNAPAPGPDISFEGLDFANWGAGHPPATN